MSNTKYYLDYELREVASAIWKIRREIEDKCDLDIDDLHVDHSIWDEARAAIAVMKR